MSAIRIRTVLDASPAASPKHLGQVLLLAHTWAAWGRGDPRVRLEVVAMGAVPDRLAGPLRELEVDVIPAQEHALAPALRFANKLVGLQCDSEPVLLVDNDVCFLDRVAPIDGRSVQAAPAGAARLSAAQWREVERRTGLAPIPARWTPLWVAAQPRPLRPRRSYRGLYFNGGVIWARDGPAFGRAWGECMARIHAAFAADPAPPQPLVRSDQAGLATAIAGYGGFDRLPLACNFRPECFALGLSEAPRILHLTQPVTGGLVRCSESLRGCWERGILRPIERLGAASPWRRRYGRDTEELRARAEAIRDRLLVLVADAGLDRSGLLFPTDLRPERAPQVVPEVVDVLEADAEPQEASGDAVAFPPRP